MNVNILVDLHKLKVIMEVNNLKVNKSQIARELGVDARTVGKYLNGYVKPTTRNRKSPIDDFKPIIQSLLSEESIQVFYYKRVLWQYLKDNHGLDCAQSSFRRYISNNVEFNDYFKRRKKGYISNKSTMRFETDKGQQAQLDWKENIDFVFKLVDGSSEGFDFLFNHLLHITVKIIIKHHLGIVELFAGLLILTICHHHVFQIRTGLGSLAEFIGIAENFRICQHVAKFFIFFIKVL